jgi:hypothetical protein
MEPPPKIWKEVVCLIDEPSRRTLYSNPSISFIALCVIAIALVCGVVRRASVVITTLLLVAVL